ncbi:MAG: ArsR/SmtB family transcription factor [Solirubrobacteraceae bacterium]
MKGDADIAAVAGLIGDRTRARVLLALGDGRALAASVLAQETGVSASTISGHLGKLLDAGLLAVESHGRHRYYRLAGPRVARLLESLAELSPPSPVTSLREGTRANALRTGRYCYDHLAGRLGVGIMGSLLDRGVLSGGDGQFDRTHAIRDRLSAAGHDLDYRLTPAGEGWVRSFGIDLDALRARRRPLIRYCTDWTEQRHHLAGALGAALAGELLERGWIERARNGRAVRLTETGGRALHADLDIEVGLPAA